METLHFDLERGPRRDRVLAAAVEQQLVVILLADGVQFDVQVPDPWSAYRFGLATAVVNITATRRLQRRATDAMTPPFYWVVVDAQGFEISERRMDQDPVVHTIGHAPARLECRRADDVLIWSQEVGAVLLGNTVVRPRPDEIRFTDT